jgi:two-component system sensor histidine kinase BaeS
MNSPATDAPQPKTPAQGVPRPPLPSVPALDLLPGMVGARWPVPGPPPAWLVPAAAGAGAVGAVVLPFSERLGLGVFLAGLACTVPLTILARGRRGPGAWTLGALAVGLSWVPVARDSEWLVFICVLAATCLAIAAVLDARTWPAVVGCVLAFPIGVLLSIPWLQRAARRWRRPTTGAAADDEDGAARAEAAARAAAVRRRRAAWLNGVVVGGVAAFVVGALLASADAAFAHVIDVVVPDLRFEIDLGTVPARAVTFLVLVGIVVGGAYGVLSRVTWVSVRAPRPSPAGAGHAAGWLTPLVLVGTVIGLFLALQATMLFGGADVVLRGTGISHASRARQGFGQLFLVTLIVLGLLAWTGRQAGREGSGETANRHRRLFAVAGGALTAMTLVLAGSALRRLWLYQEQYGWTVARIVVGSLELWIAFVLLAVAAAWLLRRVDTVPRLVIGSAGAALLALALAGPDALAARWNVDRFADTGRIDTAYLSMLSADAVPALDRLPEPQRWCVLHGREITDDGWTTWNLSRAASDSTLRDRPPVPPAQQASACGDLDLRAATSHP